MRRFGAITAAVVTAVALGSALAAPSAASPATQNEKPLVIIEMYGRST